MANLEQLSNKFASICAENLEDQKLTPQKILENLIKNGFSAGLASLFGQSLIDRIADARQTLALAAKKPALRDSLVATVKGEVEEYFKSREKEIVRFFEVAEDPRQYLNVISATFTAIDAGKFSDQDVISAFEAIKKLSKEGAEKLTRPITQMAFEFCKEKGLDVKIASDTHIFLISNPGQNLGNELYTHVRKRFPNAHPVVSSGEYKGRFGDYIRVENLP